VSRGASRTIATADAVIATNTAAASVHLVIRVRKFSIIDATGPNGTAYPIANFSWTLLYQKQSSVAKGEALKALFSYVVTAGQAQAAALGYAPLPRNVVSLAESTLGELETSTGKPLP